MRVGEKGGKNKSRGRRRKGWKKESLNQQERREVKKRERRKEERMTEQEKREEGGGGVDGPRSEDKWGGKEKRFKKAMDLPPPQLASGRQPKAKQKKK